MTLEEKFSVVEPVEADRRDPVELLKVAAV
jgi:hypothetical protein